MLVQKVFWQQNVQKLDLFHLNFKRAWAFVLQLGHYLGSWSQKASKHHWLHILWYLDLHKQVLKARLQKERDDEGSLWTVRWQLLHKTPASSGSRLQREQPSHLQGRVSCIYATSSSSWNFRGSIGDCCGAQTNREFCKLLVTSMNQLLFCLCILGLISVSQGKNFLSNAFFPGLPILIVWLSVSPDCK